MTKELAFISPFSPENCKRRLEGRTEKTTFWAWDYQQRTVVSVQQINRDTYTFSVYKKPKSMLELQISLRLVQVKGVLNRHEGDQTAVIGKVHHNRILEAFYWIFCLAFSVSMGFNLLVMLENPALAFLGGGLILIILVVTMWWWIDHQERQMLAVVRESLGDRGFQ